MKYTLILIFWGILFVSAAQDLSPVNGRKIKFYDDKYFLTEGIAFTDSVKENNYDRFPLSYKDKVRLPVWTLSKCSAGISVRFLSNSTSITVKWELLNNRNMNHMAGTGAKGIDLYCSIDNKWQYLNTAIPTGKENVFELAGDMSEETREFKLYLPLYDGVTNLEIGIDSLSQIEKPVRSSRYPIVFYGTSATQGGCASRPGMVHTSIISRKLNVDCLNFGFSGNGKMERPVVELISEINASCYVIDGTGNMSPLEVHENAIPLVETIRSKHPVTPIVFVECHMFEKGFFTDTVKNIVNNKNLALKAEYEKMIKNGFSDIYYIGRASETDHEGTVDGVHYTDLGFMRYADYLISKFDQLKLTKAFYRK